MTIVNDVFWQEHELLFDEFNDVYLFGSALQKDQPNDIDLILIYDGDFTPKLKKVSADLQKAVFDHFGHEAHLTILSVLEHNETQMLQKVKAVRIK